MSIKRRIDSRVTLRAIDSFASPSSPHYNITCPAYPSFIIMVRCFVEAEHVDLIICRHEMSDRKSGPCLEKVGALRARIAIDHFLAALFPISKR